MEGRVYWVTGLAGAGKTTIGNLLFQYLKKDHPNTIMFDGDALRQAFGNDLGYSREERLQCAMRYAKLCKLIVEQNIHVICCTISMFDEIREWNRSHIKNYTEVYIEVPVTILAERNQKNLYSDVKNGNTKDVVGMDLELQLPKNPDVLLFNDGTKTPEEIFETLIENLDNITKRNE